MYHFMSLSRSSANRSYGSPCPLTSYTARAPPRSYFGESSTACANSGSASPQPVIHVLIAEWNGAPAGFALYFFNFSTFVGRPGLYLEDLFVRPEQRSHGIGRALLRALARIAQERNCGRMEWAVLDWNEPALRFYRSLGARQMKEWIVHRLTPVEIGKLAAET